MSQLHVEVPSSTDSLRTHYSKFRERNDIPSAKKVLKKILQTENQFDCLIDLIRLEFESQSYAECLTLIERAFSLQGENKKGLNEFLRLQGACLIHLGQFEKAEDSLYEALKHPGRTDLVLVNLGTLDIQRKDWESATSSFRQAVAENQNNDGAWVGLALCHRYKGDHVLAFGNLEKALDLNPRNETALGLLMAWYGETKESSIYDRLRQYLIMEGENENLWLTFVKLAFKKGDQFIGRVELERLRLTHPEYLPAYQVRTQ